VLRSRKAFLPAIGAAIAELVHFAHKNLMQDSAGNRDNPRRPIIELPPAKRAATARPTNHAPSSPPDNASKSSGANNGGLPTPDNQKVTPSTPANNVTETRRAAEGGGASAVGTSSRWHSWKTAIAVLALCVSLFILGMFFFNPSNPSGVSEVENQADNKRINDSPVSPNTAARTPSRESLPPASALSKATEFPHPTAAPSRPEAKSSSTQEPPKLPLATSAEETHRNAAAKYQQGRKHYQKGNYAEAESDYREAVAIDPKFAEAWCSLGWATLNRRQSIEASQSFRKAVALKPTLANGWKGLAELYIAEADAPAAFDAIKRLQQLDRDAAVEVQRQVSPEFSQKLAIAEFPSLGVLDSQFNREFRNRYDHYALMEPDYLKRRDWPVRLARETAAGLKGKTRTPKR